MLIYLLTFYNCRSQSRGDFTSSDVRTNVSVNIRKFVTPPVLEIQDIAFTDENGNGVINAFESDHIVFQLSNSGPGPAVGLNANVLLSGSTEGIQCSKSLPIPSVEPGEEIEFRIPITSTRFTSNGVLQVDVNVIEPNNFSPDPFSVQIETESFRAPKLEVVDYSSSSEVWAPRAPVSLDLLVQNTGQSIAEDIAVNLTLPNLVNCFSNNLSTEIEYLAPSETFVLKYDIAIPNSYILNEVEVSVIVKERFNDYGDDWNHKFPLAAEGQENKIVSILATKASDPTAINRSSFTAPSAAIRISVDTTFTRLISKVAVIGKEGVLCDGTESSGQEAADIIQGELIGLYSVVERKYLEAILDEQRLALSGLVFEDADLAKAGCLAGAQGTVLVSNGCYRQKSKLQVTLVDCSTSEIYWTASSTGIIIDEYELLDALKEKLIN